VSTVLRFLSAGGQYAVPIEHCREVRPATQVQPLPASRPGVVGMLPWRDRALSVVSPLGPRGGQVIILDAGDRPFALLVDEVIGVERLDAPAAGPPPPGQELPLIAAAATRDDQLLLLVDVAAVDRWLHR
jgi:chemotaxis signal transduction protein